MSDSQECYVVVGIVAVLALGARQTPIQKRGPTSTTSTIFVRSHHRWRFTFQGTSTLTTDSGLNVADMESGSMYGSDSDGGNVWPGNFSDNPG